MKTLIFSVLFAPIATFAQNFTVSGQISSLKDGDKIYMLYSNQYNSTKIDSAVAKHGKFVLNGYYIYVPKKAFLTKNFHIERDINRDIEKENLRIFQLDQGYFKIEGKTLASSQLTSFPASQDMYKWADLFKPYHEEREKINSEAYNLSAKDTVAQAKITARHDSLTKKEQELALKFIADNPKSYYALSMIDGLFEEQPEIDIDKIKQLYQQVDTVFKDTEMAKKISKKLEARQITQIGAVAKDFTQNDVNGKPVKLSDFRGKYVLVDFWAS